MILVFRVAAWLLVAAVSFATLGPPRLRPHLNVGQDGEHALAFLLLGLIFGLAYPRHRIMATVIAVILTGAIEVMQFWAPGRHARLEDFLVDAAAVCAGFAVVAAAEWLLGRMRRSRSPNRSSR